MQHNQAAQLSFDLLVQSIRPPKSRKSDPVTSYIAAQVAKKRQTPDAYLILGALKQGPATVDRLAKIIGRPAHALGKRLPELHEAGAIRLTGKTLPGDSGTAQREWALA
jgi:predicted Rossmann fold nucleotide-binding protein DprA/Smf involved in DNA uptake